MQQESPNVEELESLVKKFSFYLILPIEFLNSEYAKLSTSVFLHMSSFFQLELK